MTKNGQSIVTGNIEHKNNTTLKTKKTEPTKKDGEPRVFAKGKQFVLLTRNI